MQIKIHKSYRDVVAICDSEILGRYFEEKDNQLELKESFYKGDEILEKELLEQIKNLAKEDATFNIVGEKSIEVAIKAGIIEKEGIKKISEIPFALVLL